MTSVLGEKLREAIEKKSLAQTISQWDDEDNKQTLKDIPVIELPKTKRVAFPITSNASRATFDYVFNHAGSTTAEVAEALVKQGQKQGSILSLCSQMVRNGLFIRDASGKLFPLVNKYEPMKNAKKLREEEAAAKEVKVEEPKAKKVVLIKRRTEGGIAALAQEEAPKRQDPYKWNADEVVEGLSVLQARELYLKLKEIFGG